MARALAAAPPSAVLGRLLAGASVEVSPRRPDDVAALGDHFPPGTETFVNLVPGADFGRSIATAAALKRAGFVPVPHLAARSLTGEAELAEALRRLAGEAGVTRVLAIGGDVAVPRGPYAAARDLIDSGLLGRHGLAAVGLAGYPEGHPALSPAAVDAALAAKLAAARAQGLDAFVVTQFCFEAAPILDWLGRARRAGMAVPVRIGIAGPTAIRTLLTFAMRCGVGPSLRMLLNQPQSSGRLLRDAAPDELVRALAAALPPAEAGTAVALHLFPFGGLAKTVAWRARALGG